MVVLEVPERKVLHFSPYCYFNINHYSDQFWVNDKQKRRILSNTNKFLSTIQGDVKVELITNFETQHEAIKNGIKLFAEKTGYDPKTIRITTQFEDFGHVVRSFDISDLPYQTINKLNLYKRNGCWFGTFNHDTMFGSIVFSRRGDLWKVMRYNRRLNPVKISKPVLPQEVWDSVEKNILNWKNHYEKYAEYGIKGKRGLILAGDPGNGKTLLCKWLAKQMRGFKVYNLNQQNLVSRLAQDSMNDLLNSPKVMIVCDDIDFDELERTPNAMSSLKSFLDGLNEKNNVRFCLFTTNNMPSEIHRPFMRPGRIDDVIKFTNPTEEMRRNLIKTWSEVIEHIDVEDLVKATDDMNFAEVHEMKIAIITNFVEHGVWKIVDWTRDEDEKKIFGFGGR